VRFGKESFARADYGLAEQNFRAAVEANPESIDAWVGLAASYDQLHRFDLADKAYAHAVRLAGQTPEMLNNLGYHYLLKGDRVQARRYLLAAAEADPANPYIQSNLYLLETWSTGEPLCDSRC
jgi:Flp pilus assembly protein TadD